MPTQCQLFSTLTEAESLELLRLQSMTYRAYKAASASGTAAPSGKGPRDQLIAPATKAPRCRPDCGDAAQNGRICVTQLKITNELRSAIRRISRAGSTQRS